MRKNINKIKLSYFGTADPSYYDISYEPLLGVSGDTFSPRKYDINPQNMCKPTNGLIAISATCLQNIGGFYAGCSYDWLKKYKPIDVIGNTIFIYNIKDEN